MSRRNICRSRCHSCDVAEFTEVEYASDSMTSPPVTCRLKNQLGFRVQFKVRVACALVNVKSSSAGCDLLFSREVCTACGNNVCEKKGRRNSTGSL